MIPNNITKEDILNAIEEIEKEGVRAGRHSSTYDLVFNGKKYPPKFVISLANRFANGVELESASFGGGKGTPAFELLKKLEFEIQKKKNNAIESLIANYKIKAKETQLKDELYKWRLVKKFNGRPNLNAEDFGAEIKSINFQNLIYPMGIAVVQNISNKYPAELKELFRMLFDPNIDLKTRINQFASKTLEIYRKDEKKLSHHQDERTIAAYLAFYDSSIYAFYKNSFYQKYCKLIGLEPAKKGEKYLHYLELLKEFVEGYIINDTELLAIKKECLTDDCYSDDNHLIFGQDILYQMLDQDNKENYWVFQGNPSVFDFKTALEQEILEDWTVSAHKDKIKIGDKVILWITGNQAGCYALAEITEEPHIKQDSPDDHLWKTKDKNDLKAGIEITHNLVDNPILKADIDALEELKDLKVGNQGTNFSATEVEYQTLLDLISSNKNSAYEEVKSVLDPMLLSEFLICLRNYVKQRNLHPEDDRISFNVRASKKRLVFIIGSRYAFCIDKINKKTEVSFIYKDALTNDSGSFTNQKKEIEAYWNRAQNIKEFDAYIKEGFDIELNRNNKNPFKRFSNKEFIEDIYQSNTVMQEKNSNKIASLNTILYGPPGTGKTYELSSNYFNKFTSKKTTVTRQEFIKTIIMERSWWEVIALVLLDIGKSKVADIFNHELLQIKVSLSNSTTITPTIWGQLQGHTIDSCESVKVQKKSAPLIFNKTQDKFWEIVKEELEQQAPELLSYHKEIQNFSENSDIEIKRYDFITFHQSFSYEDFIEGIKPNVDDEENGISYTIKDGVFKKLALRAKQDPDQDYALFIDEINRGNVSQIFGELITLIEDDKREGCENELTVKLPYSKTMFSVPPNLYIIGTMNTADRSIESLDTALRRRFSFIEMPPKPSIISKVNEESDGKVGAIVLVKLLTVINERIEKLIDKDHMIGHSYFLNVYTLADLKEAFYNKVIPLLQEYFYGDYGKIGLVLGESFVTLKNGNTKFAKFKQYDNDVTNDLQQRSVFEITSHELWQESDFLSIYE